MTSTNHIHIGNGKTIQELLPSQLHEMQYNKPTESKRFMIIKTQAERVGGGYILSQYEKPIPENPENVAFLQAAIHLATKSQNEMIERFNALYHSNMNLYDLVYNKLDKECYESGLLEQQKNALQIQKLEQNQLENELNSKKFRLAELKSSSENTIQKLVDSIEKLDYQLNKTNNRVYELENYENLAKPLNSIKIQNLSDQLNSLNNKSALELIDLDTLNQNRLNRDQQEFTTQRDSILEKSVDKSIAKYPDRLIRELFLNNKMKQEKIKFEQEIILLKQEIQDLVEKIKDLPKSDFCDRNKSHSLNFKTKIDEDEEIQFDFERKIHLPI